MGGMKEIFGDTLFETYPRSPGWKGETPSRDAAMKMKPTAKTLRELVFAEIAKSTGLTADEVGTILGRSILSVRPRCAELHKLGKIRPGGQRRTNESGMTATVWVV